MRTRSLSRNRDQYSNYSRNNQYFQQRPQQNNQNRFSRSRSRQGRRQRNFMNSQENSFSRAQQGRYQSPNRSRLTNSGRITSYNYNQNRNRQEPYRNPSSRSQNDDYLETGNNEGPFFGKHAESPEKGGTQNNKSILQDSI